MSDSRVPGLRWVVAGLALLFVGVVVGWAAATVFIPPADPSDSGQYTYVTISDGEVGAGLTLNTSASWSPSPVASNQAAGVITSISLHPGDVVKPGTVLYTVNLRPVVAMTGKVPAFRTLDTGAKGQDVLQLQNFLVQKGLLSGPPDGSFGWSTRRGVISWQRSLGLDADGVVQLGDVVFVATLPQRLLADPDLLVRGAELSGGEELISGLPPAPDFRIPVSAEQAGLVPEGAAVEIAGPKGASWQARVGGRETNDEDGVDLLLAAVSEGAICEDQCAGIPVGEASLLRSRVTTVETVAGPVVPSAALMSDPDAGLAVIDDEGVAHPVTVVATAQGMAVVDGVSSGLRVRIPAPSS